MGYRLDIDAVGKSNSICCGKLFGYGPDENFLSKQWLIDNDFIDKDQYFDYGYEGNIVLTGYELKKFLNLYIKDVELYYIYDNAALIHDIKKYISTIDETTKYVLMWG